jgi:hypothetical protein
LEFFCFGGPDVQFYLCELGDFLVGVVGLDPRGDDVSRLTHADLDTRFFNDEKPEEATSEEKQSEPKPAEEKKPEVKKAE